MFGLDVGLWLLIVAGGLILASTNPQISLPPPSLAGTAYWGLTAAALVIGIAPLVPASASSSSSPTAFSTERARVHVEAIATQPRPIGSAALGEARRYVVSQLADLGLDAQTQVVSAPDYYGQPGRSVEIINVMARIPGTASTNALAVVAHLDTDPATPGANDNASGVAVVLETARTLLAAGPWQNDVILLITDGEEPAPRFGSTPFVQDHPWFDDIGVLINLEAIGTDGPSLLSELNGPESWIVGHYVESVSHPAAFSFLTQTTALLGGSNTDFAPFRDAGVPGMEFVYAHGSSIYHTADDDPTTLSMDTLYTHGDNTVRLVHHLADQDLADPRGGDIVFFTIGRDHVVRYSSWWSVPIVLVAGAAGIVDGWRRRSIRATVRGAGAAGGSALLAAAIAVPVWLLVAGWRDRMGITESYLYLLGLSALAALASTVRLPRRREGPRAIPLESVVLVWWVVAAMSTLAAPGASYLFVWPAVALIAAGLAQRATETSWLRLPTAAVATATALILVIPAVDTFYQFSQPRPGNPDSQVLFAVALPVFLLAMLFQLAMSARVPAKFPRVDTSESVTERQRLPAGRTPWDPVNGFRIGALTGGVIALGLGLLIGVESFWLVIPGAVLGGAIGYWTERP